MKSFKNFINGEHTNASNDQLLESINPTLGRPWATIPASTEVDVQQAVDAANCALKNWRATSLEERCLFLEKLAERVSEKAEEFAATESQDQGKTITRARSIEIPRSIENLRFFARLARHKPQACFSGQGLNYTSTSPLGVVALITPWNLPLYLLTWKLAPALAMGNTVVAKPSEWTSLTALLLAETAHEIGLPKGVFNVVCGEGATAGAALVNHPDVRAVSFTGGTATGSWIGSQTGKHLKKTSLELGGKNANIVFEDADMTKAVAQSTLSAFSNQGEICLCASRFYIQESIYDEFKDKLLKSCSQLTLGDPMDPKTQMGPLVHSKHLESVAQKVDAAQKLGAKTLLGGKRTAVKGFEEGFFFEPTILENVQEDWPIQQEEVFGPVITLTPFRDAEDAIQKANHSSYGLSATVWTNHLSNAHYVANQLECGLVWVNTWMKRDLNTPFGGMKNSGIGREGGLWSLDFFSETKNICIEDRI